MSSTLAGLSTFPMIPNRRRPGTVSRRIWRRLVARSVPWLDTPVMFEPGRARLATRPVATGSPGSAKTIGTLFVACLAARAHWVPYVIIKSTFSWTNSAASSSARSFLPSAQRYSIATVCPSIQPSSRSRCTKTTTHWLPIEAVVEPRKPMVGSFPGCRARAAIGHATAAPPSSVMNSRRIIRSPRRRERSAYREFGGRRLRALEIDDKFELDRLMDRQIGRLGTFENLPGIDAYLAVAVCNVDSVTHQSARNRIVAKLVHRRQLELRSQRYDPIAPCTEERIGADEQCISMLLDERPKRRFQLPIVSRLGDFDRPIDGACRILNLSRLGFGSLIVWIDQHTNKGCIGHQFVQQPEPLCLRYRSQEADPRGIATGAVKTRDQTNLDWITTNGEHNRNRRSRSLGSKCRRFASCRGEDRHATPNEISRQRWKAIILALGPSVLYRHVLALDVAACL